MPALFLPTHPEKSVPMQRYMRDQFPFLGVQSVERRQLSRPIIQASRQLDSVELQAWLSFYYQQPAREYQYVAIDLAQANVRRLTPALYQWCVAQVTNRAWWDSVDAWRKVISTHIRLQQNLATAGSEFLTADEFWLRRVGLTLQLGWKGQTDQNYLLTAIERNQTDPEFFIQKAIGWALRDFSKTDPQWVGGVFATHELSTLAAREGQKYLRTTKND